MSLLEIQNGVKQRVQAAALELFGVELEQVNAETPPRPELGDLAFPVSFELAKLIKQGTGVKLSPRSIAEQLKAKLEATDEIARVGVAGAGYLNVFFDRAKLLSRFALETIVRGAAERLSDSRYPCVVVLLPADLALFLAGGRRAELARSADGARHGLVQLFVLGCHTRCSRTLLARQ